jgi:Tfp pilus assembly protein PilE
MKNLNAKGFGILEGLLIVVIVGLLGGAGYYVYNSQKKTNESLDSANNSLNQINSANNANENQEPQGQTDAETADKGQLAIKELGIKIKLQDYEKLSYKYVAKSGGDFYTGRYDSFATPLIKKRFLQDDSCQNLGVNIYKSTKQQDFDTKKIGGYYFWVTGSPASCGPVGGPDDNLMGRILKELVPENIEAL